MWNTVKWESLKLALPNDSWPIWIILYCVQYPEIDDNQCPIQLCISSSVSICFQAVFRCQNVRRWMSPLDAPTQGDITALLHSRSSGPGIHTSSFIRTEHSHRTFNNKLKWVAGTSHCFQLPRSIICYLQDRCSLEINQISTLSYLTEPSTTALNVSYLCI